MISYGVEETERIIQLTKEIVNEREIGIKEFRELIDLLCQKAKLNVGNNYFDPRLVITQGFFLDMQQVINHYRVGNPDEEYYERRLKDINKFKEDCVSFIQHTIMTYIEMLSVAKLIEISKLLEKKAFERA
jgi:hypothetical protein